jgi:hypothetical protein
VLHEWISSLHMIASAIEVGMKQLATIYEIRVKGHLPQHWSEWLEGLTITHDPKGETVLAGPLRDQAALFGVLLKVRDLGPTLLSMKRVDSEPSCGERAEPPTIQS